MRWDAPATPSRSTDRMPARLANVDPIGRIIIVAAGRTSDRQIAVGPRRIAGGDGQADQSLAIGVEAIRRRGPG